MNDLEQTLINQLQYLLNLLIYYISIGIYHWINILQNYWWAIGLIGGWLFISSLLIKDKNIQISFFLVFLLTMVAQPLLYFVLPDISQELWKQNYALPVKHLYSYGVGFTISGIAAFFTFRYTSSFIDRLKDRFTKKSKLQRDANTDIRDMSSVIPKKRKPYPVEKYFKKNKIFVGLGINFKPIYLSAEKWFSSHVDLIGTTGSGKGIAAGVLLTQAATVLGEAVIVLDPKDDEYEPYVLGQITRDRKAPYYHIDLTGHLGQWNPLANKTPMQIEELLSAAFGMSEKGDRCGLLPS